MQKVYIEKHKKFGKGVFAKNPLKKGKLVLIFSGKKYRALKCSLLPADIRDHAIQTSPHTWIDSKNSLGRYANHSCNPNCGVNGLRKLIAIRNIRKGEEITFDYSATENSDWYHKCECGSKNCRKTICPWQELPNKTKKKYLKLGIVSSWIVRSS